MAAYGGTEMDDENLYGIDPGEVLFTASDVGWVVGHSYIVYAPLLHRAIPFFMRVNRSGHLIPGPSGG